MDIEDGGYAARRIQLISPGQIPRDGYSERLQTGKDQTVAFAELLGRQPTSQRIVHMGVGPGLIQRPRRSPRTWQSRQANG